MRISCVGGGPAGLYFAILMKRRDPGHEITVFERDPAGLTYGWGVTLWADLLAQAPRQRSPKRARDQRGLLPLGGPGGARSGQGDGPSGRASGFSISRQRLLDILAKRAMDLGVQVHFEREIEDLSQLADSDLIVACDGVNSRLRRLHADQFQTEVEVGRNKYIWLGTTRVFDSFTYAIRRNGGRVDLVLRVWLQTATPAPASSSAPRRPGPDSVSTGLGRTRASSCWRGSSSGTSMVIR